MSEENITNVQENASDYNENTFEIFENSEIVKKSLLFCCTFSSL